MSVTINGSNILAPLVTTTSGISGAFRYVYNSSWSFNINGVAYTPINKNKVFFYNEAVSTWVVPNNVTSIYIKMWGAGGGGGAYGGWRQGSDGGGGGYSQALFNVIPGETITIRSGQRGYSRWGANKAYPDGGGSSTGGGDNQYAGSGGGSSSILISSISASQYCMFAGGGGGGGCSNGYAFNAGGAGGGISGEAAAETAYSGNGNKGKGGTQSSGGAQVSGSNTTGGAGSFNQGGTHQSGNCYGGGGGGGYYGGSSGCYDAGNSMGGGGGGSGYISPSALFGNTFSGNGRNAANSTDSDIGLASNGTFVIAQGGTEDGYGGRGLVTIYY